MSEEQSEDRFVKEKITYRRVKLELEPLKISRYLDLTSSLIKKVKKITWFMEKLSYLQKALL